MSNSIVHSDYDIICLCETWLKEDVTTASIFLQNYNVYRNDRTTTETRKLRHRRVLIAVKNHIAHELLTKSLKSDYLVIKIKLHGRTFILCCIYNAPAPSSYQWTSGEFLNLMQEVEDIESANELDQCDIIITGDINFSQTNWETLSSPNAYEIQILEKYVEVNLTQHAKTQLDVVLRSNPELIVTGQVEKLLFKKLSDQFSDHKPYGSTLLSTTDCEINRLKNHQDAFKRTDWDGRNGSIKIQSFAPYCFGSVNELVRQWYGWLWEKIVSLYPKLLTTDPGFPESYRTLSKNCNS